MVRGRLAGWMLLLPALVLYMGLLVLPSVRTLELAFYDWSGLSQDRKKWVGLANFREACRDAQFRRALRNNAALLFGGGAVAFPLAIAFALGLGRLPRPAARLARAILLFPMVLSTVGVGLLWLYVADPEKGPLTLLANGAGLASGPVAWLGPRLGIWTLAAAYVWTYVGFYAALFRAALDRVPRDLLEAARLDGASEFAVLRRVSLPLIREVLLVGAILWAIGALKAFGVIWALTQGGVNADLQVAGTFLYDQTINARQVSILRVGYGSAMSFLLLLLVIAASAPAWLRRGREAVEY